MAEQGLALFKVAVGLDLPAVFIEFTVAAHDHEQQVHAVVLGGKDDVGSRLLGIALEAVGDAAVEEFLNVLGVDEVVLGLEGPFLMLLGGGQGIGDAGDQLLDGLVAGGLHEDSRHIPGGGVLAGVVQTVDVAELGAGAAHLFDPGVHHGDEIGLIACHVVGQGDGGIIGALHNHTVQQVIDGEHLVRLQVVVVGAGGTLVDVLGQCDHILQARVLHHNQCVHQLGKAAGGHLDVRVVGVDQGAGAALVDEGRLGGVQLPVQAAQGQVAVHGAAAAENAHAAKGQVPGRGGDGGFLGGGDGGFLRVNGRRQAAYGQQQRQKPMEKAEFFHKDSSLHPRRGCPGGKNRV